MNRLPPALRHVVEQVVLGANLPDAEAEELRGDLEQYFLDGLEAGRTPEELLTRFGDPRKATADIARGAQPAPRHTAAVPRSDFWTVLGDLRSDVAHASRTMLRRPAVALTTTLVLALGIGANAVVFTVASELLLRPLPVEDPSTLVDVWPDVPGGNSFLGFSWIDYTTFRDNVSTLGSLAAFAGVPVTRGDATDGEALIAQVVSPEYFPMMGLDPHLGSLRFPDEVRFGEDPTAVLSHALWSEAFGADPGVVGRSLVLEGTPVTVAGVAPPEFRGHFIGFPVDLWLPLSAAPTFMAGFDPDDPASKPLEMIGRVRLGVAPAAAAEELNAIARRLESTYPNTNRGHRVGVTQTTGVDHSLRAAVDTFVGILIAVSLLVLVIACFNVGSVLLVRALSREREMAIRLAIGAGNGRLVRQLLAEAAFLVVLGAGAGMLLARYLNAWLADVIRRLSGGLGPELALDWRVFVLTAATALVAALLTGSAPAWHVLKKHPAGALRAPSAGSNAATRLRAVLVVGQVAVSVVLVVVTGLFVRALVEGSRADPGFDAGRVASFEVDFDREGVPTEERGALQRRLIEELGALPGVEGVTVSDAPVVGLARTPIEIDVPGLQPPPGQERWIVDARAVGAGYLATVGVRLRSGRDLRADDEGEAAPVAVVNRALAERFWPAGDAVGRVLVADGEEMRVVGVAEDHRYLAQDDTPDPLLYHSRSQSLVHRPRITIRAADPEALTAAVRAVVSDVLPTHDAVSLTPAAQVLRDTLLPQRLGALLVGGMGFAALLLAGVGLYGLVQFTVSSAVHELGVRLALGGRRRDLLVVVLRRGFFLVAIGMAIGLALALPAGRALRTFLGSVSPTDPLTFGAVVVVFTLVALVASWMPARRAARIDPVEALRGAE